MIKLSRTDRRKPTWSYLVTTDPQNENGLVYDCDVRNNEEESEIIATLRGSGVFSNLDKSLGYRLSLVKVSHDNPQHKIILCTRFYYKIDDIFEALQKALEIPHKTAA